MYLLCRMRLDGGCLAAVIVGPFSCGGASLETHPEQVFLLFATGTLSLCRLLSNLTRKRPPTAYLPLSASS